MTNRVYTLAELSQPRWKQIVTRAFDGGAAKMVTGALAAVSLMLVATTVQGQLHQERLRQQALQVQAQAAAAVGEAERGMADRVDGMVMELAHAPWSSDYIAPELQQGDAGARLLGQTGIYLRAVQPELESAEATRTAAALSVKDAIPLCLLRGDAAQEASDCAPGTACMSQRTERLFNLRQLHQGLDVLSSRWADDLRGADQMRLGALFGTMQDRLVHATPQAQRVAGEARYALVVIDEVPADLPDQMWGSRRDLVQGWPHAVRMALFDPRSGAPLLKIRRELEPTTSPVTGSATWEGPARRQAYGCSLGLELRSALHL